MNGNKIQEVDDSGEIVIRAGDMELDDKRIKLLDSIDLDHVNDAIESLKALRDWSEFQDGMTKTTGYLAGMPVELDRAMFKAESWQKGVDKAYFVMFTNLHGDNVNCWVEIPRPEPYGNEIRMWHTDGMRPISV